MDVILPLGKIQTNDEVTEASFLEELIRVIKKMAMEAFREDKELVEALRPRQIRVKVENEKQGLLFISNLAATNIVLDYSNNTLKVK